MKAEVILYLVNQFDAESLSKSSQKLTELVSAGYAITTTTVITIRDVGAILYTLIKWS